MKTFFAGLAVTAILTTTAQADVFQDFYLPPHTLGANVNGLTGTFTEDVTTSTISAEYLTLNGETFNSATSTNAAYGSQVPSLLFVLGSAGDLLYTGMYGTDTIFAGVQPLATLNVSFLGGYALAAVPVPEPASYAMMLAGLSALGFALRRRQLAA
jgi:hypothetical protein